MIFLLFLFLLSSFLVFLLWKAGEKYKIYDEANKDPLKIHRKSTSCLGGLAIFLSFATFLIYKSFNAEIIALLAAGLLIFVLGFVDDLNWRDKKKIKPIYKFLFLILFSAAASSLISFFIFQDVFGLGGALLLSFIFIFILINAVNYQDGMDGLAAGVVIISLIGFIIIGSSSGFLIPSLLIAVILGFLLFNFPPAKIFMGDSGAYFLGFMLAFLSMTFVKTNLLSFLGLIFIIGLPLFDGVFTNIRRIMAGKSIFIGDRSHFFDRLHQKGLSVLQTIFICYGVQIILVVIGILIYENTVI